MFCKFYSIRFYTGMVNSRSCDLHLFIILWTLKRQWVVEAVCDWLQSKNTWKCLHTFQTTVSVHFEEFSGSFSHIVFVFCTLGRLCYFPHCFFLPQLQWFGLWSVYSLEDPRLSIFFLFVCSLACMLSELRSWVWKIGAKAADRKFVFFNLAEL